MTAEAYKTAFPTFSRKVTYEQYTGQCLYHVTDSFDGGIQYSAPMQLWLFNGAEIFLNGQGDNIIFCSGVRISGEWVLYAAAGKIEITQHVIGSIVISLTELSCERMHIDKTIIYALEKILKSHAADVEIIKRLKRICLRSCPEYLKE